MNECMAKSNIIEYQTEVSRPLVLDGAIGSLLQMSDEQRHPVLWSSYLNITNPQAVIDLHKKYIEAGADIITTNTFRTNPAAYNKVDLEISNSEFVHRSVELAKTASAGNKNIFIAASNPPAEDSYQPERKLSKKQIEENHRAHIDMLWDADCDFILNETQSHFDEIKIISKHCSENNIPFIISLFITSDIKIMSGEDAVYVLDFIKDHDPIAIGINCVYPEIFNLLISKITFNYRWGYYLNCGSGNYNDSEIYEGVAPSEYSEIVKENYSPDLFFIGSCCGSTPSHTKAIKDAIDEQKNN